MTKKLLQSGFLLSALILFLFPAFATHAQSPCGDFIVVEEYEGEIYEERTEIENCENPFGIDDPAPFTPVFKIDGNDVSTNETVFVTEGQTSELYTEIPLELDFIGPSMDVYMASGTDYYFVGRRSGSNQMTLSANLVPGEYAAVFSRESKPILVDRPGFFKNLINLFIPATAYAYRIDESDETILIAFTVEYEPEVTGASSILFLPGIMGSHLYEESSECFGFGEQRRWFSYSDCEQLRLLTNSDGSSINDIYTKFEDESIADTVAIAGITLESLYGDFLSKMNDLEGEEIKDFTPFPYDWRLRLDQVIRMKKDSNSSKVRYVPGTSLQDGLLYKTISDMSSQSYSGKVTIVSHSNGGLVAKAFMAELAETNDPLESKIDNLILIGSPQVGTPDAVNGILHGTEIGEGFVTTQQTARRLLNTAPFGHHLLPNQHYFDGEGVSVDTPVITFKEGLATNLWRIQYGDTIDSFAELKRFLDDSSGREKPATIDLKTPEIVEGALLNYAEDLGDVLASWQPPNTLQVHQLGGSGIWTPSSIEYSSNDYCVRATQSNFTCPMYEQRLYNEIHWTLDGDGTVVLPSALAQEENQKVSRLWLDLFKYNDEKDEDEREKVHKNMFEVPEIATFVSDIAISSSSTYRYIHTTPPPVPQDIRLLFHLHSPLDMYVTSDHGTVSSTTNEISGAFYRRFGDVQYISLPENITNATLYLVGYDNGSFTLNKEIWEGQEEVSSIDFKALPTSSNTLIKLPISFDEAGIMQVDFNGDGEVDGTVVEQEDVVKIVTVDQIPEPGTEEKSSSGNSGTRINQNPRGVVAGVSTNQNVEQLKEVIRLLKLIINLLAKQNIW